MNLPPNVYAAIAAQSPGMRNRLALSQISRSARAGVRVHDPSALSSPEAAVYQGLKALFNLDRRYLYGALMVDVVNNYVKHHFVFRTTDLPNGSVGVESTHTYQHFTKPRRVFASLDQALTYILTFPHSWYDRVNLFLKEHAGEIHTRLLYSVNFQFMQ